MDTAGEEYKKGVLDGLAMAIAAVSKLSRANRSSIAKLTRAIESGIPAGWVAGIDWAMPGQDRTVRAEVKHENK